jgi:crotonobetainyl-CoA:carnitine CoA-transferase CaiB-like acyl-CoA transferase
MTPLLLDSVRVLDLSRVLAGPYATMILGDLGASIIKVERPVIGDEPRAWGPPFAPDGESAYYLSTNRNKLSIALDLESPHDRALIRDLAAGAHAVVDNYRPGTLERRGLDPLELLAANPRLVWCTLTGFGPDNPRPGYDFVVQAESGWMSITGEPDGAPMKVGVALADVIAGKDTAITVLAALAGSPVGRPPADRRHFVSLARSATAALVNVAQNVLVGGEDARRWGNAHPNLVPYQLFAARDRPMTLAVGNDAQWRAALIALDLPDLGTDDLATNPGRLAHRARVIARIAERIAERDAAHWLSRLEAAGVPCGVVRTVREALADVPSSPLTGVAPSVPGSVRLRPPRLDEHGPLIRAHGWGAFAEVARASAEA